MNAGPIRIKMQGQGVPPTILSSTFLPFMLK
jgi:hypothetical protein